MRIEFKKQKVKKSKFFKFCEENGANYFETDDETAMWIIPKKYGDGLLGIRLKKDGKVNIGIIDESCNNLESIGSSSKLYLEEQQWVIQMFTLFKKYKP